MPDPGQGGARRQQVVPVGRALLGRLVGRERRLPLGQVLQRLAEGDAGAAQPLADVAGAGEDVGQEPLAQHLGAVGPGHRLQPGRRLERGEAVAAPRRVDGDQDARLGLGRIGRVGPGGVAARRRRRLGAGARRRAAPTTSGPFSPRPSTSTSQRPGLSKRREAVKRRDPEMGRSPTLPSGAVTKRRGSARPVTSSPSSTALAPTATARGKGLSRARRGEASRTSQAVPSRSTTPAPRWPAKERAAMTDGRASATRCGRARHQVGERGRVGGGGVPERAADLDPIQRRRVAGGGEGGQLAGPPAPGPRSEPAAGRRGAAGAGRPRPWRGARRR